MSSKKSAPEEEKLYWLSGGKKMLSQFPWQKADRYYEDYLS